MENDDISVSIKTEKISSKLTIHIPFTLMFWQVHKVMRINQLCWTNIMPIPVMCVPKGPLVFSINL